jgi:sigma-B regulation protein RsbU (phosphoserine phosphatase)
MLSLEAGLASRNRELAEAYGQVSRELELARVLQLGQLPAPGAFGPVRFDWVFEASGFVGGDIFDYFALDERYLCVYLADVSGHGVAAAMMAFHAQHQLRALSQQLAPALLRQGSLAGAAVAVVSDYNQRFLQMKETSLYLTMLFCLVDTQAGEAALVQAGHPPPLHAPAGGKFAPVGEGGVPIGILPEPGYAATVVPFGPGTRLVIYSDGITDCTNAAGEIFELRRLQEALALPGASLAQAGADLHASLRAWRGAGAFEDDITFLGVEAH